MIEATGFMDVAAHDYIGTLVFYIRSDSFAPDMETEENSIELCFVGRRMTHQYFSP